MNNLFLKNISYNIISVVLNRILFALLVVIIGRKLGVEQLGTYSFLFAFTGFSFLFVGIGNQVVIRELVANKKKTGEYVWNFFSLSILLLIFAFLLLIILTEFYPLSKGIKVLVYLCGLVFASDYIRSLPNLVFKSRQKFKFSATSSIIQQVITVVFAVLFIFFGKGILWILYAFLIGNIVSAVYSFFILFRHFLRFKAYKLNLFLWWRWVKQGTYFLLQTGFRVWPHNLSLLVISWVLGNYYIGIYSAASKVTWAVYFLYGGFVGVAYTRYSLYSRVKSKLKKEYNRCMTYTFFSALFLSLCLITFSDKIITFVYGSKFSESITILQVLSISLLFTLPNINSLTFLNAIKKEKINCCVYMVTCLLYIPLSIWAIESYGLNGLAASRLVSAFFQFLVLHWYIRIKMR